MSQVEQPIVNTPIQENTSDTPNASDISSATTSEAAQQQESAYLICSNIPVMDAVDGIKFDFNSGLRVMFPKGSDLGPWRLIFKDDEADIILFNDVAEQDTMVMSIKKYYIKYNFQIFRQKELDADPTAKPIFEHTFDCTGKQVMIEMPVPTLGDTLGWFPYADKFQKQHNCEVLVVLEPKFIPILEKQYPNLKLITKKEIQDYQPYATYYVGLFFKGDVDNQSSDFRFVGNHRTSGYILGVDPTEVPPKFDLSAPRQIQEPYVCIGSHASSQAKYWNNPIGWYAVVKFLKDNGYRVLSIDRDFVYGQDLAQHYIPHGTEDFTGPLPLQERINLLKDADFFIGLSSGLSWVAWGCGIPVVMISGFSHETNEFYTPYRVINYHICNSCWNDFRENFDHNDFFWCPRHKGTPRQYECTRLISSTQVINAIKRIPQFIEHVKNLNK